MYVTSMSDDNDTNGVIKKIRMTGDRGYVVSGGLKNPIGIHIDFAG